VSPIEKKMPGARSGDGSTPLPAQAKGSSAQGAVVESTASTDEEASSSGRETG
jgi:hypothetical protein